MINLFSFFLYNFIAKFRMAFFEFEIEKLKTLFPDKSATLKEDLDDDELAAVSNLGVLKFQPHLYLGN